MMMQCIEEQINCTIYAYGIRTYLNSHLMNSLQMQKVRYLISLLDLSRTTLVFQTCWA